jgi:predicted ArsR family transcriptional regulator
VYAALGLDAEAVPPVVRFLRALPDEVRTAEAKAVADGLGVPERTCEKWLKDLTEDGALVKVRRGLYRKPTP